MLGDVFKAAGAGAIGRFTPSLPATGHARYQAQRIGFHPIAKALLKDIGKLAVGHLQNALWKGTFVEHHTIAAEQCASQRGGAPVQGQQRCVHAYFFKPSKAVAG